MADMAVGSGPPPNYQELLKGFRSADAQRDAMVSEILYKYEQLQQKYNDKCDDFNNEVESRRMWQGKARDTSSSPFVVAILDGDGALFHDSMYASGKDGGAEAAHQLQVEIRNHLKSVYPEGNVGDWNIMVHVILNLQGLGSKLQACGIILNPELAAFGRQFGLTQALFSFIDVGSGKERADEKIREHFKLFMPMAQCKHVFLGPCHDNGYLPLLERYKSEPTMASRITLIETIPAERGFVDLGFKRIRLPRIFRSSHLPASPHHLPKLNGLGTTPLPDRTNSAVKSPAPAPAPVSPKSPSRAPSVDSTASSTWATVSHADASSKKINIASKGKTNRKFIPLTVDDERLDQELPKTDSSAEYRFSDRVKSKGKFCNNHHLGGKCASGAEYCDYYHGDKLSPGELLVLKHKGRSLHCPNKWNCRDFNCYMGHHCKFGSACRLDYCRFDDTHSMDIRPAKRYFEDGTEEWLTSYLNKQ